MNSVVFQKHSCEVQVYSLLKLSLCLCFNRQGFLKTLHIAWFNACCFSTLHMKSCHLPFQWQHQSAMQTDLAYAWINHIHTLADLGRVYSETESFLRVTQSPLHARQKCRRRKKVSQQEWLDPQGNCHCPPLEGLLELPTRGSLEHAVCTLQLPTVWSWTLRTISQKGWTLFSLLYLFKDYCHFLK